jgi:hypothetical protein
MDMEVIKKGECESCFGLIHGSREETGRGKLKWFIGSGGAAAIQNFGTVYAICADNDS